MSNRGIDIRQDVDRIVFRALMMDSGGAVITSGTCTLRVFRVEDDGSLDVYDWTTNDFVAPGSGTPDDETTMTQRVYRDSTGADLNTGIWSVILTTLTNWTVGQVYIIYIDGLTGQFPDVQAREFQFGGVEGSEAYNDAVRSMTIGEAEAGTLSTTVMTTNLTEATDDHYKNKLVTWVTGILTGQSARISAYLGTTGKLTYSGITEEPGVADKFVIT